MTGWITLSRTLTDHWIYEDSRFDKAHAWIDLLMLANFADKKTVYKGEVITCKRGDVNYSVKFLSERWGWNRRTVKSFLQTLEKEKMIVAEYTTNRTTITVVNYDKYQISKDELHNGLHSEVHNELHNELHTNNKGNKGNKGKEIINNIDNKYPSSFETFWNHYPRKQDKGNAYKCYQARLNDGYTEEQLLTACKNYAAECEKEKRDKKYIKVGSTFLSVNEPFVDYLKGGVEVGGNVAGISERDEEQRNAEIDRYLASDEFRNAKNDLPFV